MRSSHASAWIDVRAGSNVRAPGRVVYTAPVMLSEEDIGHVEWSTPTEEERPTIILDEHYVRPAGALLDKAERAGAALAAALGGAL